MPYSTKPMDLGDHLLPDHVFDELHKSVTKSYPTVSIVIFIDSVYHSYITLRNYIHDPNH